MTKCECGKEFKCREGCNAADTLSCCCNDCVIKNLTIYALKNDNIGVDEIVEKYLNEMNRCGTGTAISVKQLRTIFIANLI